MKRGYKGGDEVRKGAAVGPDYAESHYSNPWNVGIDKTYGNGDDKTLLSPTATVEGMGVLELHDKESYDSNWEHGTRAVVSGKGGKRDPSRWTPRGKGEN
jgi:hypothetical protein